MNRILKQNLRRDLRKKRTRAKIYGTSEKPRFSVFRSNSYTSVQIIDDSKGQTLISSSTRGLEKKAKNKSAQANMLGEVLAEKAKKSGIQDVIFDRGLYRYHGRVKALVDSFTAKLKK